jgi:hypothetical protein
MLQQQRSTEAILSALIHHCSLSRRQAYRYLLQAQQHLEVRAIPEAKAVFTVNLPCPLIEAFRACCRRQGRRLSHVAAEALQRWLEEVSAHG